MSLKSWFKSKAKAAVTPAVAPSGSANILKETWAKTADGVRVTFDLELTVLPLGSAIMKPRELEAIALAVGGAEARRVLSGSMLEDLRKSPSAACEKMRDGLREDIAKMAQMTLLDLGMSKIVAPDLGVPAVAGRASHAAAERASMIQRVNEAVASAERGLAKNITVGKPLSFKKG